MDDGKPFPAGFKPDLVLKPVIKELARTQVCFPDLKLLVDRISIVTLPVAEHATPNEAYRLYLTDGERTIQGACILDMAYARTEGLMNPPYSCTQAKMLQTRDKPRCPGRVLCYSEKLSAGKREEAVRDG